MELDEKVQRSGEELLQRICQQTEEEVFGFVTKLLTAAATERRQVVQEESARIRAEVETTWEAKLREANDTADERLESGLRTAREEADRHLAQKVASVRDEGQKVLVAALEAARQEAARTLALRLDEVRKEAQPTPPVPQTDAILGRLLDGVRRLDQASRLTDVLDTLAELAGKTAPRAAVLTVQGDRVRGWRFVGFGPTLDEALQVDLKCGEAGIVGRAVVRGEPSSVVSGPNGVPGDAEPAFTTLPLGVHALAVPLLVGVQVMAVVYGDDAERRPAAAWRESLEVLARHAGHCLEAVTAVRAAQVARQDVESLLPEAARSTMPVRRGRRQAPKA